MKTCRLRLYVRFFLCLLLSGCVSKHIEQKTFFWQQQEARFYDIPVMLHAKPDYAYQDQNDNTSALIAYTVESTYNDIQAYYINQMERYGWRHLTTVSGHEMTLVFEKPLRLSIVSLRALSKSEIKVVVTQGHL